jgi:hypothetical protein
MARRKRPAADEPARDPAACLDPLCKLLLDEVDRPPRPHPPNPPRRGRSGGERRDRAGNEARRCTAGSRVAPGICRISGAACVFGVPR